MTQQEDSRKRSLQRTREMLEQSGSGPATIDTTPEPPRVGAEDAPAAAPDGTSVQAGLPIVRGNLRPIPETGPAPKLDDENQRDSGVDVLPK